MLEIILIRHSPANFNTCLLVIGECRILKDLAMRRTKIIATLGPGTDRPGILREILASGVDVVRLNFSHGDREEHLRRAGQVRRLGKELDRQVGIMADLPGAKIRIGGFRDGQVELVGKAPFVFDPDIPADGGTEKGVGLNYPDLAF